MNALALEASLRRPPLASNPEMNMISLALSHSAALRRPAAPEVARVELASLPQWEEHAHPIVSRDGRASKCELDFDLSAQGVAPPPAVDLNDLRTKARLRLRRGGGGVRGGGGRGGGNGSGTSDGGVVVPLSRSS